MEFELFQIMGKARFESYAPSNNIGAEQNARATGLNQPPIVFLSSIIPTINAKNVVRINSKNFRDWKKYIQNN